jgi:hypothetical protein
VVGLWTSSYSFSCSLRTAKTKENAAATATREQQPVNCREQPLPRRIICREGKGKLTVTIPSGQQQFVCVEEEESSFVKRRKQSVDRKQQLVKGEKSWTVDVKQQILDSLCDSGSIVCFS